MNPLVSILIPTYNSEKWIKPTIESALAQTWKNKEIIIVDDGSTDNTYRIAKQYESKILKVLTQENSGACVARNKAFSISQGDFIQWLDSDDLLDPCKIETQLSRSDYNAQSKVLHCAAWGSFYFRISKAKFISTRLWQDLSPVEWLITRFNERCYLPTVTWLVSRKLTDLSGLWNENLLRNQDGEYLCRMVAQSEYVMFHRNAICYYRKGNFESISGSNSRKKIESLNLSHNLCVNHLLQLENSENTRKACINYLQRFNNNIYLKHYDIVKANQKRIVELGGEITLPTETKKTNILKYIIGINATQTLKKWVWNLEITFRTKWDKLLAYITGEEIKY
jgi:glycosyltransferase involved in cell wall biosynthesis